MPVQAIRRAIAGLVPNRILQGMRVRRELRRGEPELRLVPILLEAGGTFLDVGANHGVYATYASRYASAVHVFEPHPELSKTLRSTFAGKAQVHNVALSDHAGSVAFHIPLLGKTDVHSRGSIEECHAVDFTNMRSVTVECRPLDDFAFGEIALIKIDVEGHELAVLRGSLETLANHRPAVIVELEDFRMPGCFEEVKALMSGLGYQGFYIHRDEVKSLDGFDIDAHQRRENRLEYGDKSRDPDFINNFLFIHSTRKRPIALGMNG